MSQTVKNILMVVLLVGFGVFLFALGDGDTTTETPTSSPATSSQETGTEVPDNWQTYENARFDFRIAHPPETSINTEGPEDRYVKFTVLGPDNATGDITDGFTFTIGTHNKPADTTLREFVRQRIAEDGISELVSQITDTTYKDGQALSYTTEGGFGITNYLATEHTNSRIVIISYNISDPQDRGYQDIVDSMLNSLELTAISGADDASGQVSRIQLALLDTELEEGQEPERGCDLVAPITRDIASTRAPLTKALEELFALERTEVQGFYNFIAETNDTLAFDRATVENGTANIYLTGELNGLSGVCDNPRAKIQIEETAFQFPTVENVQIFLNDEPTDLQLNERGE